MRLRSYWKIHSDLYVNSFRNGLYDLVEAYGAYVAWEKVSNKLTSFEEYIEEKKQIVEYSFITIAHAEFQKYYSEKFYQFIPKRKMRHLIESRRKRFVITYDWMPKYLDFFTDGIERKPELKQYVEKHFYKLCDRCEEHFDDGLQLRTCEDKVLGYQYDLLSRLSENGRGKDALKANKILEDISVYDNFNIIIRNCLSAK